MLKQPDAIKFQSQNPQPPLGGCVLKQVVDMMVQVFFIQPPLGGCVLKPDTAETSSDGAPPAAFRRLCVETFLSVGSRQWRENQPPLGGCVLKL